MPAVEAVRIVPEEEVNPVGVQAPESRVAVAVAVMKIGYVDLLKFDHLGSYEDVLRTIWSHGNLLFLLTGMES